LILERELQARHGARVLERFWLVKALLVEVPLGEVIDLSQRADVTYIEPELTRDVPPNNGNPDDDVEDGRLRIVSDPYFNLGLRSGWVGLLDTGLRFTHDQFTAPSHIDFRLDCVNGGPTCGVSGTTFNPNDDCWNHGTSSGAILTANWNQGTVYRGVTDIVVDSFKVYPTSFDSGGTCTGQLITSAVLHACQMAVAVLDRVIVAEIEGSGSHVSVISIAADNAFDAGTVVIAANGNQGPNPGTVNAPASAHKVIGVGAFNVRSRVQFTTQSRGPTLDLRVKPDVQAPSMTETASNISDTSLQVFGGTSGAAPYVAGAAALLRNWLRKWSGVTDPGQVYAQLILSGGKPYPFDNTKGAGPVELPTSGVAWWTKIVVHNGETVDIPIMIRPAWTEANTFDGAIWWPETAQQFSFLTAEQHSDIDLSLIDPLGNLGDESVDLYSVFERARIVGPVNTGTWKLRIRGNAVPGDGQTVYVAAHVRLR
jgi:subtilisin family serine protease